MADTSDTATGSANFAQVTAGTQQQVTLSTYVEIDGTICNDCYNLPETAKIIHAVSMQFSADRTKRLLSRGQGVWHLQTQNMDMYKETEFLLYGGQNIAKLSVKTEKCFLNSEGKMVRSSTYGRMNSS